MIFVYVLRSIANRKRYIGITEDLSRRLGEHRKSSSTVAKLLGPFDVLQKEALPDYVAARIREKFLKSGQGRAWLDKKYPR
jgi:putative endonuclease